jgi:hypothetical protein
MADPNLIAVLDRIQQNHTETIQLLTTLIELLAPPTIKIIPKIHQIITMNHHLAIYDHKIENQGGMEAYELKFQIFPRV